MENTKIDEKLLFTYIKLFKEFVNSKNIENGIINENIYFHDASSWLYSEESFKLKVRDKAIIELQLNKWNENIIGNGFISACVLQSYKVSGNILVNYRQVNDLSNVVNSNIEKSEQVFFDIFKRDEVGIAFEKACELFGRKYDLISYLFFLKDNTKYMQIRSSEFDARFKRLNINYKTSRNCSWENYVGYNNILLEIKKYLQDSFLETIELLDAHSFLWIIGETKFIDWCNSNTNKFDNIIDSEEFYYNADYYELNKPRIKTKEEWIKILEVEEKFKGFNFVEKVLIPMYHKNNHMIFLGQFEKETNNKGLNLRVGEFRDRIRKLFSEDELPIQKRDDTGNDRAWNIPFLSEEWISNNSKEKGTFCWILRPELIQALELKYPEIMDKQESLIKLDTNIVSEISAYEILKKAKKINKIYQVPTTYKKKIDYNKRQQQKKIIGDSGEKLVVELEKQNLVNKGLIELADKVKIVESDSYGYDIESYDEKGNIKHIEVKTCSSNTFSFFISQYEIDTFEHDEYYCLYYIYNIRRKTKIIKYNHSQIKELLDRFKKPSTYIVEFE